MPPSGETALGGRRVLELADESGSYCGKLLADMGADVIKVEPPGGDPTRHIPPFLADKPGDQRSLFFLSMNTSKRGVTLDITQPRGRALVEQLAERVDVMVETFAPGTLDALGLGYRALRERNPRLVVTSITGFGQTGPRRGQRSSDLVASALGGVMHVTGDAEDPPMRQAGSQNHVIASTCAAASSLIALHHATRSGQGQHVDISVHECTVSMSHIVGIGKWLDDRLVARRRGAGLFHSVPSGTYPCKDGSVYLMINRPAHWEALAHWIHEITGNEDALDPMFRGPSSNRIPYRELLDVFISDMTQQLTVEEVYREGQRRRIAFTPVNTAARLVQDRQLTARDYFVETDGPDGEPLRMAGAPFRHGRTPWRIGRPAPRIGEHNQEVFVEELGVAPDVYRALQEDGVIGTP